MAGNLPPEEIYKFIVGDFEDAWFSVLNNPHANSRGNFMFGRQAMTLLEWASRLAAADESGAAIGALSQELEKIEPKYFITLPGPCFNSREFRLPHDPSDGHSNQDPLLWLVFDVVRNGQAHQYQQILVSLSNGKNFQVILTGAEPNPYTQASLSFSGPLPEGPPYDHLAFGLDGDGDLYLVIHPDKLLNNTRQAIDTSGLLNRGLSFDYLTRPFQRPSGPRQPQRHLYEFSSHELEQSFSDGGLHRRS